jgi:circadian clock protein KaiB
MTGTVSEAVPYRFLLFVAGKEPNSVLAEENLRHICAEFLKKGTCTVTIVDIMEDFQAAMDYSVLVSPTLVVEGPRGRATIIGNLSDVDRILLTLGCNA